MKSHLTFAELREVDVRRCEEAFHQVPEWSPTDWGCAIAGEVGEACNHLKKLRRGECIPIKAIADELADAVIYIDLLASRLGIDLGAAIVDKFNEVSRRKWDGPGDPPWLL